MPTHTHMHTPTHTHMHTHTGEMPKNHEILREIACLCDQLPVLENKTFERDFHSVSGPVEAVLSHCFLDPIYCADFPPL